MVEMSYTGANGVRHDISAENAKDAMARLSRLPGYVNREADAMTAMLGGGMRERRKRRAAEFAAGAPVGGGNQQVVARQGIGTSTVIPGFGGNIVRNGRVVGAKTFDIKVENGMIVGTSGMREELFTEESDEDFSSRLAEWFNGFFKVWWEKNRMSLGV